MPRIPMDNRSNYLEHTRSAAPIGANGMTLKNFGDGGTAKALLNLADSGSNLMQTGVNAISAYAKEKQHSEDRLAAAEARSLHRKIFSDLEFRMKNNPANFKDFEKWTADAGKEYEKLVAPVTARMSGEYRKLFTTEMSATAHETQNRFNLIGREANITANLNLFQAQIKDAALRGDAAEFKRLLTEQRGRLINEQTYQRYQLQYDNLAEFGAIKRELEADTPGLAAKLTARNADGSYANFTHISQAHREQFIRAARAQQSQRFTAEAMEISDRINQGEVITRQEVEKKYPAGKLSIDDELQKFRLLDIVGRSEKRRMQNELNLERLDFIDRLEAGEKFTPEMIKEMFAGTEDSVENQEQKQWMLNTLARHNAKKLNDIREGEKLRQAKAEQERQKQVDYMEWRIIDDGLPVDPDKRQEAYNKGLMQISIFAAGDVAAYKKLKSTLDGVYNDMNKGDKAVMESPVYKYGKSLLQTWLKEKKILTGKGDPRPGENYQQMLIYFQKYMLLNPKATPTEVKNILTELRNKVYHMDSNNLTAEHARLRSQIPSSADMNLVRRQDPKTGKIYLFDPKTKKFVKEEGKR